MAASRLLDGVRVLLLTSGHLATDHRVYYKEALSLSSLGAQVKVVGPFPNGLASPPPLIVPMVRSPARLKRFLLQPWRCLDVASTFDADIWHLHDAELLQIVPLLRLLRPSVKIVYDVHEDFPQLIQLRQYVPGAVKPVARLSLDLVEKRLASLVHGVVAVTPQLAARFSVRHAAALYNFPAKAFYDEAAHTCRPTPDRQYDVVHFGTLSPQRARFLTQVLWELQRRRPGTRCLISGAHAEAEAFLRANVPPDCDVEGLIPYSSVTQRLGNARIGLDIHPFRGAHLDVALPVKVLEYMACGCAVVASSMPVLDTLCCAAGLTPDLVPLLHNATPASYAACIVHTLEAIHTGCDPGAELRRRASQHFVWESEMSKLVELYQHLLHGDSA